MSWNFSIIPVTKGEWAAAVKAAVPTGQPMDAAGLADDVAAAKAALIALGARVKRPRVGGTAGGHALQANEGANWSDSLNVSVYGLGDS